MAIPISSLPLQERISCKSNVNRALHLTILFLYASLLYYRFVSIDKHGTIWLLSALCESWFAFLWLLNVSSSWNPVEYKTYPDRLLDRFGELPPVDIFVTTADPVLEPPIITVNTVLSLMALDYPANKLACYVSDDSASAITFYTLQEAINFAKLWVPYCKKYNVQVRAPFQYFSDHDPKPKAPTHINLLEYLEESAMMKNEYGNLCKKVEEATQNSIPCDLTGESATFSKIERGNHPTIVKIIWENKEDAADGVPHLVYVSREKRPKQPHHFKAGAMNVLTRVSGVMTNAPFMLNVDCDMFANNPHIVLHAMCLHLGIKSEGESAFVQCPQHFYGGIKDDPFGNQMIVWQQKIVHGFAGIQGPIYTGSGCFHRRKATYGLSPGEADSALEKRFGSSKEFTESAEKLISDMNRRSDSPCNLINSLKAASHVADCSYESHTEWGKKVGWVYGSATEDILTGQRIHAMGWSTVYCKPDPVPFLGCAPSAGPIINVQMKRWTTGLLEILFSSKNPITATIVGHLWFRQCLVYISIYFWGIGCIPEFCYAILPASAILSNTSFVPKVMDPTTLVAASVFILYHVYYLSEYLNCGLSVRNWWNNRRMALITSSTGRLFGVLAIILKLLGLSETVFEITPKDQSSKDNDIKADPGRFTFDNSPMFVPGTALLIVNMAALAVGLMRLIWTHQSETGMSEIICSAWVVLSFLPYVKGLYRKGKYGIPSSVICKSVVLAGLFVHFVKGCQKEVD